MSTVSIWTKLDIIQCMHLTCSSSSGWLWKCGECSCSSSDGRIDSNGVDCTLLELHAGGLSGLCG